MHEIDLIPSEFFVERTKRRWLTMALLVAGALIAVNLAGFGVFRYLGETAQEKVQRLSSVKAISERQGGRLKHLEDERQGLEKKLRLLEGLRGGIDVKSIFVAIDRALEEGVWFQSCRFQREGIEVNKKTTLKSNGYFIVLPNKEGSKEEQRLQIQTHMSIRGRARDHAALSGFVSNLVEQKEIANARVVRTTRSASGMEEMVEFELAVVISGNYGGGA